MNLTNAERVELVRRTKSRTGRAEDARRAHVVLLLAEGCTWDEVCDRRLGGFVEGGISLGRP